MPHYHLITPCDGEWIRPTLTPCKIMVPWAHSSQPPNGISIRSAFFAVLNCWWTWPTDPQTHTKRDRQTDRARYSVCSNSPHLKPRPHQRQCRRLWRHCRWCGRGFKQCMRCDLIMWSIEDCKRKTQQLLII